MSVIAKWSGAGLTDGTVVTNTTAGTGDTHFDTVLASAPGAFTVRNGGAYSPRIELTSPTAPSAHLIWLAALSSGTYPQHAIRFYIELAALPTGNAQIFSMRDNLNNLMWWLDITALGILRLRNEGGTALALSQQPLSLNKPIRIEGTCNVGDVSVFVYKGDSQIPIETLSGSGVNTRSAQQVRFGTPNNANLLPHMYFDEMAFANTLDLIGPVVPAPALPLSVWDGSKETSLAVYGVWDGTALQDYSAIDQYG